MLLVLQLSVWPTTFGINLMLLFNNITPPSEQSVHKELEYCFILLSSLTKFTCLDMTCRCRNKQLFITVSSVSLFSYAILLSSWSCLILITRNYICNGQAQIMKMFMACLFINLCIYFWMEKDFIKCVHTVQITCDLRIKDNASARSHLQYTHLYFMQEQSGLLSNNKRLQKIFTYIKKFCNLVFNS